MKQRFILVIVGFVLVLVNIDTVIASYKQTTNKTIDTKKQVHLDLQKQEISTEVLKQTYFVTNSSSVEVNRDGTSNEIPVILDDYVTTVSLILSYEFPEANETNDVSVDFLESCLDKLGANTQVTYSVYPMDDYKSGIIDLTIAIYEDVDTIGIDVQTVVNIIGDIDAVDVKDGMFTNWDILHMMLRLANGELISIAPNSLYTDTQESTVTSTNAKDNKKDFSVYPNPVLKGNNKVTITLNLTELDKQREVYISLYSLKGALLNEKVISTRGGSMNDLYDISGLNEGMYFIKVLDSVTQTQWVERLAIVN